MRYQTLSSRGIPRAAGGANTTPLLGIGMASRKVSSAVVRVFAIIVIVTLLVLDAPVRSTVAIAAIGACVTTSGPICAVSALVAVFSGIEGSVSGSTGDSIEEG
ncbi:hypothetical protein V1506DRAFT_548013 [Lipomyces tetrasporus]